MLKRLTILSLVLMPFMLNLSAYKDSDEEFFSLFVAPDVLIILDSSGSMTWNMDGENTHGDGTIGGDFNYNPHGPKGGHGGNSYPVKHPFYGYAPDWYNNGDPDCYGNKSRMHIVKTAMETTLVRISGTFRWGLATFYQKRNSSPSIPTLFTNYYRAWSRHITIWGDTIYLAFPPTLRWIGEETRYAVDQCMIRVPISNAQEQNQSNKIHQNHVSVLLLLLFLILQEYDNVYIDEYA